MPEGSRRPPGSGFAGRLHGALRRTPGNLFFSPFSVEQAVGMVRLGAAGDTEAEIAALLDGDGGAAGRDGCGAWTACRVANALWVAADVRLRGTFRERVEREFGGEAATVEFRDERAARGRINDWVAERTENGIRELIRPGVLTPWTRLVLTNAVHLAAHWARPFDRARTERRPFRRADGDEVAVETMRMVAPFRLVVRDGMRMLSIPYGNGGAMEVVLPDAGTGSDAVEARLDAEVLRVRLEEAEAVLVDLALPRFESASFLSLRDPLRAMGMRRAFEPGAELDGIAAEPLLVGDVVHRSLVRVDEEGTEAAAATALTAPRGGRMVAPAVPFTVDRPFLFLIRDGDGRILFMGRMMDPTAGGG